jgi:tryptophan synthase alpha chain
VIPRPAPPRPRSAEPGAIGRSFARATEAGRAALVPYLTAGYPNPDATVPLLRGLEGAGADVLELGIPFSDPLADGPTIQRASQRALEAGADVAGAFAALAAYADGGACPVVLFSYLNPVLGYGLERFVREAADAGAAGVLLTDLPLGADPEVERALLDGPLDLVRLVAPTTPPRRAAAIAAEAQGFLYLVSRTGVTGARAELPADLEPRVSALRDVASVPVAVGFGISTPHQASAVARVADGVVVGSAIIDRIEAEGPDAAVALVAELRAALDDAARQPKEVAS